jgi:hypothetical protein
MPEFEELPLIVDDDDIRRVHNTAGLYLLNKSRLTAHSSPFECAEIDQITWRKVIENPVWRVATDAQVRALGGGWCVRCSS